MSNLRELLAKNAKKNPNPTINLSNQYSSKNEFGQIRQDLNELFDQVEALTKKVNELSKNSTDTATTKRATKTEEVKNAKTTKEIVDTKETKETDKAS